MKFFAFLTLCFFVAPAFSQEPQNGAEPGIKGFWEVVTPTGRFMARLDQIASVSEHQYYIDGAVRVYEVTVETDGGQTGRFYYLESPHEGGSIATGSAAAERAKSVANRVGEKVGVGDLDTIVTKHYPDTTHAKTSEYRVQSKETIGQIYDHIRRVWAQERGRGEENRLIINGG